MARVAKWPVLNAGSVEMTVRPLKIWWLLNRTESRGCLLTLALTMLILAVVLVILWSPDEGRTVTGEIVSFGWRETELGSYPVAYIVADSVRGRVRLYPSESCVLGDTVSVRIVSHWWGDRVVTRRASQLCPHH